MKRADRESCSEAGMTLVEMLATIVIMGLVMGPLTMAFVQAINLIPASSARTQAATDADRLLMDFSNDVAQAQIYRNYAPPGQVYFLALAGSFPALGPTAPVAGPLTCALTIPPVGTPVKTDMTDFWWTDKAQAGATQQSASWQLLQSNAAGRVRVDVRRSSDAGATWTTSLTEYCTPGQGTIATITSTPPLDPTMASPTQSIDGGVSVTLSGLTDERGNRLSDLTFYGKMRAGRV